MDRCGEGGGDRRRRAVGHTNAPRPHAPARAAAAGERRGFAAGRYCPRAGSSQGPARNRHQSTARNRETGQLAQAAEDGLCSGRRHQQQAAAAIKGRAERRAEPIHSRRRSITAARTGAAAGTDDFRTAPSACASTRATCGRACPARARRRRLRRVRAALERRAAGPRRHLAAIVLRRFGRTP